MSDWENAPAPDWEDAPSTPGFGTQMVDFGKDTAAMAAGAVGHLMDTGVRLGQALGGETPTPYGAPGSYQEKLTKPFQHAPHPEGPLDPKEQIRREGQQRFQNSAPVQAIKRAADTPLINTAAEAGGAALQDVGTLLGAAGGIESAGSALARTPGEVFRPSSIYTHGDTPIYDEGAASSAVPGPLTRDDFAPAKPRITPKAGESAQAAAARQGVAPTATSELPVPSKPRIAPKAGESAGAAAVRQGVIPSPTPAEDALVEFQRGLTSGITPGSAAASKFQLLIKAAERERDAQGRDGLVGLTGSQLDSGALSDQQTAARQGVAPPARAASIPGAPDVPGLPGSGGPDLHPATPPSLIAESRSIKTPSAAPDRRGAPPPDVHHPDFFDAPDNQDLKSGPASPQEQAARLAAVERGAPTLPAVRDSAITNDYATQGRDWTGKQAADPVATVQIASEGQALHSEAGRISAETGGQLGTGESASTIRGRAYQDWHDTTVDALDRHITKAYADEDETAKLIHSKGENLKGVLGDDSLIDSQDAAKVRDSLKSLAKKMGVDLDDPNATLNAYQLEALRKHANAVYKNGPRFAQGVKNAVDADLPPGAYVRGRALRQLKGDMFDNRDGINQLGPSTDINPATKLPRPENRPVKAPEVMTKIEGMDPGQVDHIMRTMKRSSSVLKSLGDDKAAETITDKALKAAQAVQSHFTERWIDEAGKGGGWNTRRAHQFLRANQETLANVMSPEQLHQMRNVNSAANVLDLDKRYKGAFAQFTTGAGWLRQRFGRVAEGIMSDLVPPGMNTVGELTGISEAIRNKLGGKGIANAPENFTRPLGQTAKGASQRGGPKIDLQQGASGESSASPEAQNRVRQETAAGQHRYQIDPDGNVTPLRGVDAVDAKAPAGHVIVQRGTGFQPYAVLDRGGLPSAQANGLLARAQGLGKLAEAERAQAPLGQTLFGGKQRGAVGNLNRPAQNKEPPATINVGLHVGDPANGGRVMTLAEVLAGIKAAGGKVGRTSVVQSDTEPTLVADLAKPFDKRTLGGLSKNLQQGAIAQRHADGTGILAGPKAAEWGGKYNPDFFRMHSGQTATESHPVLSNLTDEERAQLRSHTTQRLMDAFAKAPATEEYAAAALAGAAKRGWYANSARTIGNVFGPDAPRFSALLAAMSPQTSVEGNFHNALRTFINWDSAGRPQDPGAIKSIMRGSVQRQENGVGVLPAWENNSIRALTADDPGNVKLSGPKVHSFYSNLHDKVNEVTNDAWMATFSKFNPLKLGGSLNQSGPGKTPSYLALSARVRGAAKMLSNMTGEAWTPREVQETVWSWAKTAFEHSLSSGTEKTIPELVKQGHITDDLIRSTPDFHQLFSTPEHRGFLEGSRYAANAADVARGQGEGALPAGTVKARAAAAKTLRPHLLSAAERLEAVRQERLNEVPF